MRNEGEIRSGYELLRAVCSGESGIRYDQMEPQLQQALAAARDALAWVLAPGDLSGDAFGAALGDLWKRAEVYLLEQAKGQRRKPK